MRPRWDWIHSPTEAWLLVVRAWPLGQGLRYRMEACTGGDLTTPPPDLS